MANSFINKKVDLTTTDNTTLYTVPDANTAVINSILVSEDAGSGTTITVTLTDARNSLEFVTAVYASSRENKTIEIPIDKKNKLYNSWLPN